MFNLVHPVLNVGKRLLRTDFVIGSRRFHHRFLDDSPQWLLHLQIELEHPVVIRSTKLDELAAGIHLVEQPPELLFIRFIKMLFELGIQGGLGQVEITAV